MSKNRRPPRFAPPFLTFKKPKPNPPLTVPWYAAKKIYTTSSKQPCAEMSTTQQPTRHNNTDNRRHNNDNRRPNPNRNGGGRNNTRQGFNWKPGQKGTNNRFNHKGGGRFGNNNNAGPAPIINHKRVNVPAWHTILPRKETSVGEVQKIIYSQLDLAALRKSPLSKGMLNGDLLTTGSLPVFERVPIVVVKPVAIQNIFTALQDPQDTIFLLASINDFLELPH